MSQITSRFISKDVTTGPGEMISIDTLYRVERRREGADPYNEEYDICIGLCYVGGRADQLCEVHGAGAHPRSTR